MADIFLSYSSSDRAVVGKLVEAFEHRGFSVWWDTRIDLGTSFDKEIEKELEQAQCVIVVWSKRSVESDWVREEASEGLERGVLVPVQLDDTRPPLGFRRSQTASLTGWPADASKLDPIIARVEELVGAGASIQPPQTEYAKSGDISIAYQVIGDGPRDLIYVPGIVSHVEFSHELPGYSEFLAGLSRFARVIVFDKRGNGLSDRITGAPSIAERMEDVTAVMDAVGSEHATLFGVSEGGPISMLYAATYPERVDSLILYETFVCYGGIPGHTHVWDPEAHKKFTENWLPLYGTGVSIAGFGAAHAGNKKVQQLWGQTERLSNSPGGFKEVYEALRETDVHAAVPSVQAPCLVIAGKDVVRADSEGMKRNNPDLELDWVQESTDNWFEDHAVYMAKNLPDATLLTIEGANHFPWFSKVEEIVSEVEAFVTGTPTTPAIEAERVLSTLLFATHSIRLEDLEKFNGTPVPYNGVHVARFESPAHALSCAQAVIEGARSNQRSARCSIHTGEIELSGIMITGKTIVECQAILGFSENEQIVVSAAVRYLMNGSGYQFEEINTYKPADHIDPIALFSATPTGE